MRKLLITIVLFILAASLGAACGGSQEANSATATPAAQQALTVSTETASPALDTAADPAPSGLPEDVETYYKTMVFIQGTAQLMAKIDLEATFSSPESQAALMPLLGIPGVMDDHVIATEALPVPAGLESSWEKAIQAESSISPALEALLMAGSREDFLKTIESTTALASEAVAEAEAVLAAQYGASSDGIAAANRAALTEMGETYQLFASMILTVQSQADEDSE